MFAKILRDTRARGPISRLLNICGLRSTAALCAPHVQQIEQYKLECGPQSQVSPWALMCFEEDISSVTLSLFI